MKLAIKTISIDRLSENEGFLLDSIISEIHCHQSLFECPGGIVKLYQVFEDAGFVYLIMNLHEGGTLSEFLKENKSKVSEETILTIIE
jgi:serine/threonine protein kinase